MDTWKGLPRLDRKSDDELWHRFSHARSAFSKRRKAHFASLDAQREEARKAKEKLVAEAESLSGSTDWGADGRPLPRADGGVEGGGPRPARAEDDLWNRFRGAQDVFFAARSAVFAERDAEQTREPQAQGGAGRRGREAAAGDGPEGGPCRLPLASTSAGRPSATCRGTPGPKVEGRMHAVERALQEAEEAEWRRTNPEARARAAGLTGQLQAAVDKLRGQIDAARAAGNNAKADKLARELEGRQALLDQALKGLEEFGG